MAKLKKKIDRTMFWCMVASFATALLSFLLAEFEFGIVAVFIGLFCACRLRSPITAEEAWRAWSFDVRVPDKIDEDKS